MAGVCGMACGQGMAKMEGEEMNRTKNDRVTPKQIKTINVPAGQYEALCADYSKALAEIKRLNHVLTGVEGILQTLQAHQRKSSSSAA